MIRHSRLNMLRRMNNQIRLFSTTVREMNTLTLFVNNLPWTVSRKELQQYFSQFGPLANTEVAFDNRTGISRGFGYVTFIFSKSLVKALQTKDHMLEGKLLQVGQAKYDSKADSL